MEAIAEATEGLRSPASQGHVEDAGGTNLELEGEEEALTVAKKMTRKQAAKVGGLSKKMPKSLAKKIAGVTKRQTK